MYNSVYCSRLVSSVPHPSPLAVRSFAIVLLLGFGLLPVQAGQPQGILGYGALETFGIENCAETLQSPESELSIACQVIITGCAGDPSSTSARYVSFKGSPTTTPPPSSLGVVTVSVRDGCNDGNRIDYRYFAFNSGNRITGRWPDGNQIYHTTHYNRVVTHNLACNSGTEQVSLGQGKATSTGIGELTKIEGAATAATVVRQAVNSLMRHMDLDAGDLRYTPEAGE